MTMSKERELIKDMKILLECTSMGGLQRNADVLIGRAIELLAKPETEQEPVAWMSLEKGDVNTSRSYFKFPEQYENETIVPLYTSILTRKPLSDDVIRKFADDSYFICNDAFKKGVRWAETQHKIGENCEQS